MAATGRMTKGGFAAIASEKLKEIARRGGQAVQRLGKAQYIYQGRSTQRRQKGGQAVSCDRVHMATIGHRGAVSPRRQRAKTRRP